MQINSSEHSCNPLTGKERLRICYLYYYQKRGPVSQSQIKMSEHSWNPQMKRTSICYVICIITKGGVQNASRAKKQPRILSEPIIRARPRHRARLMTGKKFEKRFGWASSSGNDWSLWWEHENDFGKTMPRPALPCPGWPERWRCQVFLRGLAALEWTA